VGLLHPAVGAAAVEFPIPKCENDDVRHPDHERRDEQVGTGDGLRVGDEFADQERERTFRIFEDYDLSGDPEISYQKLAAEYAIPVTDVTNALSWARREFRRIALERLGELCGSEEEFHREARAVFGSDVA